MTYLAAAPSLDPRARVSSPIAGKRLAPVADLVGGTACARQRKVGHAVGPVRPACTRCTVVAEVISSAAVMRVMLVVVDMSVLADRVILSAPQCFGAAR